MARFTKGHPKVGGRVKGTPNKATAEIKSFISAFLDDYIESGNMSADFFGIEDPKDRLIIAEKLMQYTIPKMQNVAVDLSAENCSITIEDKLDSLMSATKANKGTGD